MKTAMPRKGRKESTTGPLTDRSDRAHDTDVNHGRTRNEPTEPQRLRAAARVRRQLWPFWYRTLRILAAVLLLQLSGIAHAAVDTWDALAAETQPCSDGCENDHSGRECPPGCPKCHCSHVAPAVLQERAGELVALPTSDGAATLAPAEASSPSRGQPLFVFRPPKSPLLLA